MTVTEVAIQGYRSIKKIRFPLRRLTVLVGGNGVGKTNLYRSLELLHAAATGTLAEEIAKEGGLGSALWAGGKNLTEDGSFDPMYRADGYRKGEKIRMIFEAQLDNILDDTEQRDGPSTHHRIEADFSSGYRIEIGFPRPGTAAFGHEMQIKEERFWLRHGRRDVTLMERKDLGLAAREGKGNLVPVKDAFLTNESALAGLGGRGYIELDALRFAMSGWRFYHSVRTDPDSPLRRPCPAITSPMLASDGRNLAAVFATLSVIRQDRYEVDVAVDNAFPGSRLELEMQGGMVDLALRMPGVPRRPFPSRELSDGQLHFLALLGALLSYRLPPFVALNEPETSLHPSLLPALAKVIAKASERTQLWVVTHSQALADAIAAETGVLPREVVRREESTWIEGLSQIGTFIDD